MFASQRTNRIEVKKNCCPKKRTTMNIAAFRGNRKGCRVSNEFHLGIKIYGRLIVFLYFVRFVFVNGQKIFNKKKSFF